MDDSEKKYAAFITIAIHDLYHDDISKLMNKTYSGRKKEAITPSKIKILQNLFKERLENDSNNKKHENVSKQRSKF